MSTNISVESQLPPTFVPAVSRTASNQTSVTTSPTTRWQVVYEHRQRRRYYSSVAVSASDTGEAVMKTIRGFYFNKSRPEDLILRALLCQRIVVAIADRSQLSFADLEASTSTSTSTQPCRVFIADLDHSEMLNHAFAYPPLVRSVSNFGFTYSDFIASSSTLATKVLVIHLQFSYVRAMQLVVMFLLLFSLFSTLVGFLGRSAALGLSVFGILLATLPVFQASVWWLAHR